MSANRKILPKLEVFTENAEVCTITALCHCFLSGFDHRGAVWMKLRPGTVPGMVKGAEAAVAEGG